jgi:hypothetical protein
MFFGACRYKWRAERIFLFGYGQGATAAIDAALACPRLLGGVVAVAPTPGCFLPEAFRDEPAAMTAADAAVRLARARKLLHRNVPLLVLRGTQGDNPPVEAIRRQVAVLQALPAVDGETPARLPEQPTVQMHEFPKGVGMLSSPAEMRVLFTFLGARLTLTTTMEQLAAQAKASGETVSFIELPSALTP